MLHYRAFRAVRAHKVFKAPKVYKEFKVPKAWAVKVLRAFKD